MPGARKVLGLALLNTGQLDEALDQLQTAADLKPDSPEYRYNLGLVLGMRGDLAKAIDSLEAAVSMSSGKDWRFLAVLAATYDKAGRPSDAARTMQQALDLATAQHDDQTATQLSGALDHYRQEITPAPSQ